jgi:hypothetical protein
LGGLPLAATISVGGSGLRRGIVIVVVLIAVIAAWTGVRRLLPSSIDYRGKKIKLSKFYLDYDDYKNDPDNIDPTETARVQKLVTEAPIARSFPSRMEAVGAVSEIKFPGYGMGGFGAPKPDSEGALAGFSVEIPRADKDRYFIFRNVGHRYLLVDDFICSDLSGLRSFRQEGDNLVYAGESGEPKLVRPMLMSN